MALTTCGDCGNQISTNAPACPNCGKPLPKNRSTLITLLLVIAVTLVLGAIIAYMVIQKRAEAEVATWETTASINMRNLADNELLYQLKTGKYGSLNDLINAGLVERAFATEKGGYIYRIQSSPTSYTITAHPAHYGEWGKGKLSYYMATDRVVHRADKGGEDATASDPVETY